MGAKGAILHPMSKQNIELVQRGFIAFSRGDLDDLFAVVDEIASPDFELRAVGRLPDVSPARGREAVNDWFGQILETFEFRIEPEEFIDAGDSVVVVVRQIARGRASGAETTNRIVLVFGAREGKLTYCDAYPSKAKALEAVGLPA
jgi:ketosteroid isomerase-like protein